MKEENGIILEIDASKEVVEEFRRGVQVQGALAKIHQEKINEDTRRMQARMIPGVGQCIARVDADVYWFFRHKFGQDIWKEPDFIKSCLKHGTVEKPKVEKKATIIRS